jgi:hypothetical protein
VLSAAGTAASRLADGVASTDGASDRVSGASGAVRSGASGRRPTSGRSENRGDADAVCALGGSGRSRRTTGGDGSAVVGGTRGADVTAVTRWTVRAGGRGLCDAAAVNVRGAGASDVTSAAGARVIGWTGGSGPASPSSARTTLTVGGGSSL